MIKKCAVCGKWFDVLYPHLWRYKREERYFCSWSCIRINDKGKEANEMRGHRLLTQEQKSREVEIALAGENPLPYLKECGASNPSASWNYIRKAAILEDPEKADQLKKPLPARKPALKKVDLIYDPEIAEEYKREQAQKAANAAARAAQFPGIETPEGHILQGIPNAAARVEAEKKCTVPLNYDGFYVTAVRAPYGEFHYDKKHDLLEFKGAGGEEVSYSPMSWKIIIEDVKKIMKILGVEV